MPRSPLLAPPCCGSEVGYPGRAKLVAVREQRAETHRSQAAPLRLVEDRRQRLDGLPSRAAAARAVAVVEEHDCARLEEATHPLDDRLNARARRVEDAAVPAAHAVAARRDGSAEPRAEDAVRRAEERRRRLSRGRGDGLLGAVELAAHRSREREREQPVVVAVARELVTRGGELA